MTQNSLLVKTHRPFPPPDRPWLMGMNWEDLLFMHWPIDPPAMRRIVPESLEIDTFDGAAWIGIVPLLMNRVHLRGLPPVPGTGRFPELNVRTYVRHRGVPGVYFFTLDAASALAVWGARATFRLRYMHAAMDLEHRGGWIHYDSHRIHPGAPEANLRLRYRPTGPVFDAHPGSLESFLTDRYCLYAVTGRGQVLRADVDHAPWPLQPAEAEVEINTMTTGLPLPLPDVAPRCHFAKCVETHAWWRVGV